MRRVALLRRGMMILPSLGAGGALAVNDEEEWRSRSEAVYASTCSLPTTWTACRLVAVRAQTHDTSIFTFATPGGRPLALPTCACVMVRARGREHGGGDAVRAYTPIGESAERGTFDVLVKRYAEWGYKPEGRFETEAFRRSYRPEGAVSTYVHSLTVGDALEFAHVRDNVKVQYPFRGVRRINMIAVGAGIAPMIQALDRVLSTPDDETRVVLLYGSRAPEDVLMRDRLEAWARTYPDRFRLVYCVGSRWANVTFGAKQRTRDQGASWDRVPDAPPELAGIDDLRSHARVERGWVGREAIERHAFPPAPDTRTFVCGLPAVYDTLCGPRQERDSCTGHLGDLGYQADHVSCRDDTCSAFFDSSFL